MNKVKLGVICAAGAVIALIAASVLAVARVTAAPDRGAIAGVLDTKGRLTLVDLESGKVTRTVKLRSWAFDIAADDQNGTFITAQSGGLDEDCDDRIGIIAARKRAPVRYVRLPQENPGGVELFGSGQVLVDHGIDTQEGTFVCVVDTEKRRVVRTGHVPNLNTSIRVIDGVGWVCCAQTDGRRSLRTIDPLTLDSVEVFSGSGFPLVETSGGGALYGWLIPEPGEGSIARFDAKTGAVEASAPVAFEDGAGRMLYVRGRIVAADFSGSDIEHGGTRLLVFDPATLRVEREIRVSGSPCDMAVWRDRLVVAEYLDQRLLVIDPVTGRTEKTVDLPKMTPLPFMVSVLD